MTKHRRPTAPRSAGTSPPALATEPIPVVGVGASAGGVEAFGKLLADLPADTGMAYVLIQHLAPNHTSHLPELIARHTTLPVVEAHDGVVLAADHVYAVAAGTEITLVGDRLVVTPRRSPATVDVLLRSLAHERGDRAIGVILSGTGSDGTLGALAIQKESGLVFAQDPATCEHDGMPRSAIAAGSVDRVLALGDMGRELSRVARHAFVKSPSDPDRAATRRETPALALIQRFELRLPAGRARRPQGDRRRGRRRRGDPAG
jgi:two-component system CheB/CheR fusion protein